MATCHTCSGKGRRELIEIGSVLSYHIPLLKVYPDFLFIVLCRSRGIGIRILGMIFLRYYSSFATTSYNSATTHCYTSCLE